MTTNQRNYLITLYIIGAVITFGHAWNRDYSKTADKEATAFIVAPLASALWPLYWSTVLWRNK